MSEFKKIRMQDFQVNPFEMVGKDWMLITAEKDGRTNAMTASWGGFGVLWNRNVAFVFVRQSRYTKELIDSSDHFSLTFYNTEKYRKMLNYMGNISGRNEDKISNSGLTLVHENGIPYFQEADTVLLCKKLSRHFLSSAGFINSTIDSQWYDDRDYHDIYVVEIEQILVKE